MGWRYDEHKVTLNVVLKMRDRWAKRRDQNCLGGTNEDWYQWIIWWRARRDIIADEIKNLHVKRRAQQRSKDEHNQRDYRGNTKPSPSRRASLR